MSWKVEIFRAFFVAFGAMETILNSQYLLKPNGLEGARKQHGELPKGISDEKIRRKVICMLISGILFLVTGLCSFLFKRSFPIGFGILLGLFAIYACVEAGYYRFRNTFGFAAVAIVAFVVYIV